MKLNANEAVVLLTMGGWEDGPNFGDCRRGEASEGSRRRSTE